MSVTRWPVDSRLPVDLSGSVEYGKVEDPIYLVGLTCHYLNCGICKQNIFQPKTYHTVDTVGFCPRCLIQSPWAFSYSAPFPCPRSRDAPGGLQRYAESWRKFWHYANSESVLKKNIYCLKLLFTLRIQAHKPFARLIGQCPFRSRAELIAILFQLSCSRSELTKTESVWAECWKNYHRTRTWRWIFSW